MAFPPDPEPQDAPPSRRALGGLLVAGPAVLALGAEPAQGAPQPPVSPPGPAVMSKAGFEGLHVMKGTPAYADTPLGRLHYWSLGSGPAIILLHQGPLFSVEFARIQPLLADLGYRALAVDIPGFGFSQRPDHPATGDEYADSLVAMLDALGIEQAIIAGTHTGATLALAFAARHPQRTACLVLQSVPIYSPEELEERVGAPPPSTEIFGDGRQISRWWSRLSQKYPGLLESPETMQWLLIGTLLSGDFNWYGEDTGRTFVTRAFDSARAILKVRSPTLILGVTGDGLEASVQRALQARPDFTHVEAPGGPGLLTLDSPERWVAAVRDFIGQHRPA